MIDNYLDLIPSENRYKPKFIEWISTKLEIIDSIKMLSEQYYTYFDINTAVGNQLDIVGEIVGVSRLLNFIPSVGTGILDDDTYRKIIKGKIAKNNWDGTIDGIYSIWAKVFNTPLIIYDNQDMTIEVLVYGLNNILDQELVLNGYFVPKAAGVKYNYGFIEAGSEILLGQYTHEYLSNFTHEELSNLL